MLVKYVLDETSTFADYVSDIANIIEGNVATVNDLSNSADKTRCVIYGTYPTGVYTRVNQTSYTYSKVSHIDSNYTHYFRLNFDDANEVITSMQLAQNYDAPSDTLINSGAYTLGTGMFKTSIYSRPAVYILVNEKCIALQLLTSKGGIFDLGHSGLTRAFTDTMLMGYTNFTTNFYIPYTYNYSTLSYAAATKSITSGSQYRYTVPGQMVLFEQPMYLSNDVAARSVYGMYKVASMLPYVGNPVFPNQNNEYRLGFATDKLVFPVD